MKQQQQYCVMAPSPVKIYSVTGDSSHRLEIQESGITILYANSNNKYGPWKDPYVTIHEDSRNGQIVAAAKMGCPGLKKDFRIWLGNPDCTDLKTWPTVKCIGAWAHEYNFSINVGDGLHFQFAWRRTKDKNLGAVGKGHRDFKLVAINPPLRYAETGSKSVRCYEKHLLDLDIDEVVDDNCFLSQEELKLQLPGERERVVAIYTHEPNWYTNSRQARINFFEHLPWEVELWCLAAVMGLQEKISRNLDAFTCYSAGYGGGLRPLGKYV